MTRVEVARLMGVTTQMVGVWEKEGLLEPYRRVGAIKMRTSLQYFMNFIISPNRNLTLIIYK